MLNTKQKNAVVVTQLSSFFLDVFVIYCAGCEFKVCVHQCKKQVFATILHLLTSCLTLFTEAIMLEFMLEFQLISVILSLMSAVRALRQTSIKCRF